MSERPSVIDQGQEFKTKISWKFSQIPAQVWTLAYEGTARTIGVQSTQPRRLGPANTLKFTCIIWWNPLMHQSSWESENLTNYYGFFLGYVHESGKKCHRSSPTLQVLKWNHFTETRNHQQPQIKGDPVHLPNQNRDDTFLMWNDSIGFDWTHCHLMKTTFRFEIVFYYSPNKQR